MPISRTPALALLALLALIALILGGGALPVAAQDGVCTEGVVSSIAVRNNSLFAPEDIEGRKFDWAMSFVNFMHFRTRDGFLREELLLEEGDCFDAHALSESERLIRDLDFIARIETRAEQLPDSTWAINVETWDEWTTQVGIDFDVESSFQFKGFYVTEKNLVGRGLRLSFRYRDFRERNDRFLTLSTGRFLGTRANAAIGAGTTRTGNFVRGELAYPFVSEAGRFQLDSRLQREDKEYSYLTGNHDDFSHVLFPMDEVTGWFRLARRWGRPGALRVLGTELTLLHRDVTTGPRMVWQGDFHGAVPAADSLASRLVGQDHPDSYVRFGVTGGIRRLRFTTTQGLDRVTGTQNVALGSELMFTVGRTLTAFRTDDLDTYARVDGFLGGAVDGLTTTATLRAEARLVDSAPEGVSPWRDLDLNLNAQAYFQPGGSSFQTFVTGMRLDLRDNVDQPYQSALGGEFGVRSYREDEVPIGSSFVAYAEHRVNLALFKPTLDLGLTVFGDVGQGWASDVPFGNDTGWRKAVGFGIRIGAPAGTGSITRIELAWPVGGPDANRSPILRTYWSPTPTSR
ncbi:MAG: BamA/TamA family outer membrane protein [Longimicrobiales bacterium]